MSSPAATLLAAVESDVRRRFTFCATSSVSETSTSPFASASPAPLSLLTPADWTAVLCPLAPETQSEVAAATTLQDVVHYAQVRCAELPMRLQMEALQTRRYEHLLRQHTRELVTLSEYVVLVSRTPPTLTSAAAVTTMRTSAAAAAAATAATVTGAVGDVPAQPPPHPPSVDVPQLPSDVRALLAPEEVGHRLERAAERIRELEVMLRQDAEAKVQSCQRMVLLTAYVGALVKHAKAAARKTSSDAVAGVKRSRAEAEAPA